jgi:hypothetical protein
MEEESSSGLQGTEFAVAMFATMFLVTGAVLDAITSVSAGARSLVVTVVGLWLMFRLLKSARPKTQRLLGALLVVVLTVAVRVGLNKVL